MIIGIIGGGQLGMMMAESAKEYNYNIIGLDPNENCSLSSIADKMIIANYDDESAIEKLINMSDVVTYEFENVDLNMISKFENKIPQKRDALYFSRNRLIEKDFAKELGIKTPKYFKLDKQNLFYPSIVKTTTGGYDGKGQWIIKNNNDIDQVDFTSNIEYIIEEKVDFDYEISVVVTRDQFGNESYYPIPVNVHRNGILFTSSAFGDLSDLIVSKAKKFTSLLINKLNYVGTLAVEYFVRGNDVIFNEFAPRPHNSGHYTIEGCSISQFENHIRAITGLKVLKSDLVNPTIMINVLGQNISYIDRLSGDSVYYHDYGKTESRVNRKMGHITIVSNTKEESETIKRHIIKE